MDLLEAVHGLGWVHGDVRLPNVCLHAKIDMPLLIDWGHACKIDDDSRVAAVTQDLVAFVTMIFVGRGNSRLQAAATNAAYEPSPYGRLREILTQAYA